MGQYSRLNNVLPRTEGILQSRAGLTLVATPAVGTLHTIARLNQQVSNVLGERLLGLGTGLYSAPLPAGSAFAVLTGPTYDGNPLSIVDFRFDNDNAAWAIVGNGAAMMKRRRPALYQALGQAAPTVAATGVDGGAGNLNSTGGPGYDWVYTFMNGVVRTESNPSPANFATSITQRPSANTNPDPQFGGNACTNPANAYDGNSATFAQFVADDGAHTSQTCLYTGWGSAGTGSGAVTLFIDSEVTVSGSSTNLFIYVYYSTDAGVTWTTVYTSNGQRDRVTDTINIPSAVDTTQIRIRAAAIYATTSDGGGGGVPGGGGNTCFSGNTRVVTIGGPRRFDTMPPACTVAVHKADGQRVWREATLIVHEAHKGDMCDMGLGELVTPGHMMKAGDWVPAAILWDERVPFDGTVFNLHIDTEEEDEHNYILANGRVAHNIAKTSIE